MKRLILIIALILATSQAWAANRYVDDPGDGVEAGATWNGTDGQSYSCAHGTGTGYSTIQAAVTAMTGGDHIYIRGGTYIEQVTISYTQNGTAGTFLTDGSTSTFSSIESYPLEWAIIDGTGTTGRHLLGSGAVNSDEDNSQSYWRFERLEIRDYPTHGIAFYGGPVVVRYCYIHTPNSYDGDGDNPAGIYGIVMHDSIIEYNLLDDNGGQDPGTKIHFNDIMPVSDYYWNCSGSGNPYDYCTGAFNRDTNYRSASEWVSNNQIRYNYLPNSTNRATTSYRVKAQQFLDAKTTVDFSTKGNLGDKFHHNVAFGIIGEQDFLQVYNNIFLDALDLTLVAPGYTTGMTGMVAYNNTLFGGRIAASFGYSGTSIPTPYVWAYNNLIDEGADPVTIFEQLSMHGRNGNVITESRITFDRNYCYRASDTYDYIYMDYTDSTVDKERHMTTADYNTAYSRTNYAKASSEGSDNLYSSGYLTRGAHVITGATTIANGGIGGNHPYLSGVTIPSYVGATNPSDNAWVAGVLALDVTYFTGVTAGSTPAWIEGSEVAESRGMRGTGSMKGSLFFK